VVPVSDDGDVVALVSVGITMERVAGELRDDLPSIGFAVIGALRWAARRWLISRRLRRQTHGMGGREITGTYEYYGAVLQAVREGLVLTDAEGRVQLVNDEARRLLSLPDDVVGRSLAGPRTVPRLVAAATGSPSRSAPRTTSPPTACTPSCP
jgi:sensor histidine kinase regulating citrate/malate metabolism